MIRAKGSGLIEALFLLLLVSGLALAQARAHTTVLHGMNDAAARFRERSSRLWWPGEAGVSVNCAIVPLPSHHAEQCDIAGGTEHVVLGE